MILDDPSNMSYKRILFEANKADILALKIILSKLWEISVRNNSINSLR